jgi:hypothetical protein
VLAEEFGRLAEPPSAVLLERKSGHKPFQARVGAEYTTDASYEEIRAFYDGELVRNSWRLVSDEATTDWGRNLGGHLTCYRKANYWAILDYGYGTVGRTSRVLFEIDLTWGSSVCS